MRFSTTTNGTPLNFEVEKWNAGGISYVWGQVPAVTNSATTLYAFWGRAATLSIYTANGATWSNAFISVCHLTTNTTAMRDSSPARRTSTVSGTISTALGMVGDACDFTPTPYFDQSGAFPHLSGAYSVSAWVNLDVNSRTICISWGAGRPAEGVPDSFWH